MSVVHRLDTLIDAMTARHGHSPMGLEMACVRLIQEQHAEIERLRGVLKRIETLKVYADGAPASAYQTEGWMRELAREALEGER